MSQWIDESNQNDVTDLTCVQIAWVVKDVEKPLLRRGGL